MFNRQRTLEKFGYDIDETVRRRTRVEIDSAGSINKKDLLVIDNCPDCGIEREIKLRQSRKNAPCSKCFHNSPQMIEAKQNQTKTKTEEHKQRMRDNHWSKKGMESPFKDKTHSEEVKQIIAINTSKQMKSYSKEELHSLKVKESCTKRGIAIEEFDGFSAPEGTRLRQSAEGKAWTYDVLSKSNFTCEVCSQRGGSLQAHHLNSFNSFPEQRFDIENGVCLCEDCHKEFHIVYGQGDNTIEQYLEFIKNKPQLDIGLYSNKN